MAVDMWTCGKCGQQTETARPICWNCGASRAEAAVGSTAASPRPSSEAPQPELRTSGSSTALLLRILAWTTLVLGLFGSLLVLSQMSTVEVPVIGTNPFSLGETQRITNPFGIALGLAGILQSLVLFGLLSGLAAVLDNQAEQFRLLTRGGDRSSGIPGRGSSETPAAELLPGGGIPHSNTTLVEGQNHRCETCGKLLPAGEVAVAGERGYFCRAHAAYAS